MPKRIRRSKRASDDGQSSCQKTQSATEHINEVADMVQLMPLNVLHCIMWYMASISLQAYLSCMQTCKTFNAISNAKDVIQNINFDDYTFWNPNWMVWLGGYRFFWRLLENENPRALFHLGLRQFCSRGQIDEGLRNLEKSSRLGYHTATYALGLIHLGGSAIKPGKEEGMRLLSKAKRCLRYDIHECHNILRHECTNIRGRRNFTYHEYYPLNYNADDHNDTCINLSERYFLSYGLEEREMGKCRTCELILECRQFRVWFGKRIKFPITD